MGPLEFHLGEDALEVRVAGKALRKVKYCDVESVQPGYAMWNEHWNNFWPMKFVTIRRKTGWIKNFVVNPADRDTFCKDLQDKVDQFNNNRQG